MLGGYFEAREFKNTDDSVIFGNDALAVLGLPPSADVVDGEVDTTTLAGFGQISYQLVEALTLVAGLRYESTDVTLQRLERTFTTDGFPSLITLAAEGIEQNSDAVLPRVAIEYRFSPNAMVYGSIAREFKPAGVNSRAADATTLTFGAERSWNYEIGLKSSWFDNKLTVNLAAFYSPVDDYQVVFSDAATLSPSAIANAGASIAGFELEAKATPVRGLDIIAGLGYTDTEFTDFTDPVTGVSFNGNRLPFAPDFTYNLAVQYRAPNGILGRVELRGFGTTFFDEANTLKQDPFAILNARLGYEFENYGIYVFANNIFDTRYVSFASAFSGGIGLYGAPTTVGVQLRARF